MRGSLEIERVHSTCPAAIRYRRGMELRAATAADHAAFVRLFAELGAPDPVPDAARFAAEVVPGMIVACDPEPVGYALWRSYGATAHVVHLAVDRTARRRGLGRALLDRVREAALAAGCTRWYLNVKRDNAPAIRLYEACGFQLELQSWALRVPWAVAATLPSGGVGPVVGATAPSGDVAAPGPRIVVGATGSPGDVVAAEVAPADDAAIAARFGLEPGRVTSLRTRQGYVAVAVREGGELAGFAAFDPGFPGASPFCVARPELAGALLWACRAHARPDHDHIRLAIEGDRATAELLIAAGAALAFELLRLASPL